MSKNKVIFLLLEIMMVLLLILLKTMTTKDIL